jgi:hypothetical protein
MVVGPEGVKVGCGTPITKELVPVVVIVTMPFCVKLVFGVAPVESVKLGYEPLTAMLPPLVMLRGKSGDVLVITEPDVMEIPDPFV